MTSPILTRKESPLALEAVRKKMLRDVKAVEKEVQLFLDRYTHNIGHPGGWGEYLENACDAVSHDSESSLTYESITHYKQLDQLLNKVRGHVTQERFRSGEYDELRRMSERGQMFEYIEYNVKNDLVSLYEDRLDKFCVSFYDPVYGDRLRAVKEYETRIEAWRKEVETHLNKVDQDMDYIDRYTGGGSVKSYVDNYRSIVQHMESSCRGMLAACQPMKTWLNADAKYPDQLQEEINTYRRGRRGLTEVIDSTAESRDREERRLARLAAERHKLEQQLVSAAERQKLLKGRDQSLMDGHARTSQEYQNKQKDLQEFQKKAQDAHKKITYDDTSVHDHWKKLHEDCTYELHTLQNKLENQTKQLERIRVEQSTVQREIDRLSADITARAEGENLISARLEKHSRDLYEIRDSEEIREENVTSLKRIREAKLHSHVLKNIDKYGYNPTKLLEMKSGVVNDETREAFTITSDSIGKDWETLYKRLPFKPERDPRQLIRDIEVIDISNRRLDEGFDLLAYKSLEKWRRLSNVATVDQLIRTLRKIKRHDIADRIAVDERGAHQRADRQ